MKWAVAYLLLVLLNLAVIDYSRTIGLVFFIALIPLYSITMSRFMHSKMD